MDRQAAPSFEAFFLPGTPPRGGERMALHHLPPGPARGSVLHVHGLAEELNKTRRMTAMTSQALAAAGYGVLRMDLLGCGDSSGDFSEATWAHWLDDVVQGAQWLQARHPGPLWLWGVRAGCLLAAEAAQRLGGERHFIFWQPQSSGKLALQQFLRLKMASQLEAGANKGVTETLLRDLASRRTVDIAGYGIGPGLAEGLQQATLAKPPELDRAALVWLEVSSRESAELLPGSLAPLDRWRQAGCQVSAQVVSGPPFWQTVDIEDAPELIRATVEAISGLRSPARS